MSIAFEEREVIEELPTFEDRLRPARKLWRVYFNCRADFPFLAAVDNGTIASQIRVQRVQMFGVTTACGSTDMGPVELPPTSAYFKESDLRARRKGKQNEPTWWVEFEAYAVFENGGVSFYGESA